MHNLDMDKYEKRRINLLKLRDTKCEGKVTALAKKIDRDPSYVSRMLYPEGKAGKKRIADDMMDVIELAFSLSRHWMDADHTPDLSQHYNTEPIEAEGLVPLISWVAAGTFCNIEVSYEAESAEDWLLCPVKHSSRTYALRVKGDSMHNPSRKASFTDGDVIFIDPERSGTHGSYVVVRMDDDNQATFKRLIIEGNRKMLEALNPAWPDRIIEIKDNATICGVVIAKLVSFI